MMATTLQKIQDAAGRVARLGRYVATSGSTGATVERDKGAVLMAYEGAPSTIGCVPREGRVWLRFPDGSNSTDMTQEEGLQILLAFEADIKLKAEKQALDEVLAELVARKIRRVTRPKTRGFKADQKQLKKPRLNQGSSS